MKQRTSPAAAMGYLQELQRRGRDANPFFALLGIDVVSFGNGQAELTMEGGPKMLKGAGWMQGGLFAALTDEAMALALFTELEEDDCYLAQQRLLQFLGYDLGDPQSWLMACSCCREASHKPSAARSPCSSSCTCC